MTKWRKRKYVTVGHDDFQSSYHKNTSMLNGNEWCSDKNLHFSHALNCTSRTFGYATPITRHTYFAVFNPLAMELDI